MQIHRASILIIGLMVLSWAVEASEFAFSGPRLTFDNFAETTAKGTWLVKHYSPSCPHCAKLAPVWDRLGGELTYLKEDKHFYLAQVDCHAQTDLCDDHDVRFYPNMVLYHNGERVDEYMKKATYENLKTWMLSRAEQWGPSPPPPVVKAPPPVAPQPVAVVSPPVAVVPANAKKAEDIVKQDQVAIAQQFQVEDEKLAPKWNIKGESIVLTTETFEKLVANGPWMIKFFAPWCGHCKHLAPIWTQMASELAGKTNVGQVDCTQESALCTQYDVKGYPTIKMINYGAATDFTGPRQLEPLKAFALKASSSPIVDIKLSELDALKTTHDVFYLLVDQDKKSHISRNFELIARGLMSRLSFYHISTDASLAKAELKLGRLPSLVVFKDNAITVYTKSLDDHKTMKDWIVSEQYPALITLDDANARELLLGEKMVVLALLNPEADSFSSKKAAIHKIAIDYNKKRTEGSIYIHPHQQVIFVWLDAVKWSSYAERAYRITLNDLPRIIYVDPKESEYFDVNGDHQAVKFESVDVLSTLEDVQRGRIQGKSTLGSLAGLLKTGAKHVMTVGSTAKSNPLMSIVVVVGILGGVYYWMKKRGEYESVGTKMD